MTRSLLVATKIVLVFAWAALGGCGSESVGADAANDAPSLADSPTGEASSGERLPATDGAVADTVAPVDTLAAVDTQPAGPDVGSAMSSVARVLDPQVTAADSATLASDNAAFAFAAYKQLIVTEGNLVFSPISISIALAMAYAGAAGTTATEMAQALHFSLPPAQLHPAFNALDQTLASRGEGKLGADGTPMRLHIVNAAWAERSYVFRSDFLATLAGNYGAGVKLLDFAGAPDPSRLTINAWVAAQTEDRILNLLPDGIIDSSVKLVLTDAVYFNAQWAVPFDPSETNSGPFVRLDGSSVSTKFMMADLPALPALQGTNFKAISLPYADRRLSMLVVVPDAGQFAQVESGLDQVALQAIVAGLTPKTVALALPRFRTETAANLGEVLQSLGMISAFAPGMADFSGMDGSHNLYVSAVRHQAFIDVAEKGTEAAAATAVVMKDAGLLMVDLSVWVDHPFLYVVRDEPTGAILFMGRVLDPSMN